MKRTTNWLNVLTLIGVGLVIGLYLSPPQTVEGRTGIGLAKTAVIQSEYRPVPGAQQISLSTTATALTVPGGAYIAHIQAYDGNVRYRDDGTDPTTSTGMCIFAGGDYRYDGDLDAIKLIAESGTVEVNVLYYGR
jgi:hypothetical protein